MYRFSTTMTLAKITEIMKKTCWLFLLLFLPAGLVVQAQNLYAAQNGTVTFFSDAPLEDIEAKNNKAQSIINLTAREVAVKVPIKSFVFENSLMQEHFNENYLESDKYPFATFKGRINENIDLTKEGTYDVSVTGKMNIHGVERDQTIKGKIQVLAGKMLLQADFPVLLADHKIEVPTLVFQKIAEKIAVKTDFALVPYVKQ